MICGREVFNFRPFPASKLLPYSITSHLLTLCEPTYIFFFKHLTAAGCCILADVANGSISLKNCPILFKPLQLSCCRLWDEDEKEIFFSVLNNNIGPNQYGPAKKLKIILSSNSKALAFDTQTEGSFLFLDLD